VRFAPAAARNREPILAALRAELEEDALLPPTVLELGSGTGQHVCHFARALPQLRFQPSEHPAALDDLAERVRREGTANIAPPLALDVSVHPWPVARAGLCLSANTVHMMNDAGVEGLFRGAAACLPSGGKLCLYGPFAVDGVHTGEGNRAFDAALRDRAPGTGVRDLARLDEIGRAHALAPTRRRAMPRDNLFVVWTRGDFVVPTRGDFAAPTRGDDAKDESPTGA